MDKSLNYLAMDPDGVIVNGFEKPPVFIEHYGGLFSNTTGSAIEQQEVTADLKKWLKPGTVWVRIPDGQRPKHCHYMLHEDSCWVQIYRV